MVFRQVPRLVSGTSAATPVRLMPFAHRTTMRGPSPNILLTASVQAVAGIIAFLNDYLISEGLKPLGFLNPFLYSDGIDGLNDIVSGSNPGCGTQGFVAIPGWDAVRECPPSDSLFGLLLDSIGDGSWVAGLFQTDKYTFSDKDRSGYDKAELLSHSYLRRTRIIKKWSGRNCKVQ